MEPAYLNATSTYCHFLIVLLFFSAPFGTNKVDEEEDGFKLLKKKNDMEMYERWIGEDGKKDRREVKMSMLVDANIQTIVETLLDEERGGQWNVNANGYQIKKLSGTKWISYTWYSLPFPMSNRECYLLHELSQKGPEATINFNTHSSEIFSEGHKREKIEGIEGKWAISDKGNQCLVSYHIISVPDSSMPKWLVDPIVRKNLWGTMEKLREMIHAD